MNPDQFPRISLAHLPTPVEELPRLSRELGGPRILVKRDDLTGLAGGGNKTRKLELLLADAISQSADIVITAGAAQSNHCRQTAGAAARTGLACGLVLGGEEPPAGSVQGNLLLDYLLGARFFWCGAHRKGEDLELVAGKLQAEGRRPYVVPYGGSNPIGALGYVLAMLELNRQQLPGDLSLEQIDRIVFPSSSGGTQAGIVVGARLADYRGQVLGIGIDKKTGGAGAFQDHMAQLAQGAADLIDLKAAFSGNNFVVNQDYLGGGYGVLGELEREAIGMAARLEGLLLDPVYTGRAMGGLIDLVRRGTIGAHETILFWHTGGQPGLYAYADALV